MRHENAIYWKRITDADCLTQSYQVSLRPITDTCIGLWVVVRSLDREWDPGHFNQLYLFNTVLYS